MGIKRMLLWSVQWSQSTLSCIKWFTEVLWVGTMKVLGSLCFKHSPPNRKEKTNKCNTKWLCCLHGKITRHCLFLGTTKENNDFLLPKPRLVTISMPANIKRPVLCCAALWNGQQSSSQPEEIKTLKSNEAYRYEERSSKCCWPPCAQAVRLLPQLCSKHQELFLNPRL